MIVFGTIILNKSHQFTIKTSIGVRHYTLPPVGDDETLHADGCGTRNFLTWNIERFRGRYLFIFIFFILIMLEFLEIKLLENKKHICTIVNDLIVSVLTLCQVHPVLDPIQSPSSPFYLKLKNVNHIHQPKFSPFFPHKLARCHQASA